MDDEAAQDVRPSQERPRWSPVAPLLANHILLGDKNAAECFTTSEMAIQRWSWKRRIAGTWPRM